MNYEKIKEVKNFVKTNFNNIIETHNLNDDDNIVTKSFFEQMYNLIVKNYYLINNHNNIKSFNGLNYQMFDINDMFDYKKSNYPFNVMLSNGIGKAITYTLSENLKTKLFFIFSNTNNINTINEIVLNEIRNLLLVKEMLYNDIKSFIKYHYHYQNGNTVVYVDFSTFFNEMTNYFIFTDLIVGYDEQIDMCDLKLQSIILWEKNNTKSYLAHGYCLQFLKRVLSEKYNKYHMNYIPDLISDMALYRDIPCEDEVIIKFKTNMIICL